MSTRSPSYPPSPHPSTSCCLMNGQHWPPLTALTETMQASSSYSSTNHTLRKRSREENWDLLCCRVCLKMCSLVFFGVQLTCIASTELRCLLETLWSTFNPWTNLKETKGLLTYSKLNSMKEQIQHWFEKEWAICGATTKHNKQTLMSDQATLMSIYKCRQS